MCDLRVDAIAGGSTTAALSYFDEHFGRRAGRGVAMAANALRLAIPEDQIRAVCAAFVDQLLDAVEHGR
jgi:hypothetical protein